MIAADEMGLPLVINNPAGPLSFYQSFGIGGALNYNTQSKVCCGKMYVS